jgi:hypothetical protein
MMTMVSCPIPGADLPLCSETIERWLADGLAQAWLTMSVIEGIADLPGEHPHFSV